MSIQNKKSPPVVSKGQDIEIRVEGLAFGGNGFAKINNFMVFIERGLPGQLVQAYIYKKKSNYAEAYIKAVIEESPFYVPPQCPHFGLQGCGGCIWQNLNYTEQLKYKEAQVRECIQRIGGFRDFSVEPIIGSESIYFYRNKMEFSFGDRPWHLEKVENSENQPEMVLGLHVPGRFDRIMEITSCQLLSPLSNEILGFVRQFAESSGIKVWHNREHTGFWRHVVFREAKNSGQLMVNLVTSGESESLPVVKNLAQQLLTKFPQITTLVHNINRKISQVATGDEEIVLAGPGKIIEELGKFRFSISANSFFQTNTRQARILYDKVIEFADFQGHETVYDLYCGTGTIGIYLSPFVKRVIGFEIVPDAIRDARLNCELNQVQNCEFFEGDLKDLLIQNSQAKTALPAPDTLVIDPPRAGMHEKVVNEIIKLAPQKIVYVSCNPSTLARDLKLLCTTDYRLIKVQPIDLFPHTPHCEAVALLNHQ